MVDVFNFEMENAHTYYVTDKGVLVHNDCISDELSKIANKYDDFKCVECADEMKSFLNTRRIEYQQIEFQFGVPKNGGYVFSNSLS